MVSLHKKSVKYFLLTVRLSYLYAVSICAIALLIVAWFYCCYKPLDRAIEYNQQINSTFQKEHTNLFRLQQLKPRLEQSVKQLQQCIISYADKQPTGQVLHGAVLHIAHCAMAQKLELRTCRLCNAHDKQWCKLNQITAEFSGSINQIISFFETLKNSKRLIKCKKFELTKQANNNYSCACVFQLLTVI